LEEAAEFLTIAWQAAAEKLPTVVTDNPSAMLWADAPTVELRLSAERRINATPTPQPMLDEYIDMSPLGRSDRGQLAEMAVTITAPPHLDPFVRRDRTPRGAGVYGAAIRIPRCHRGPL
jgi:hypothetical protein